MVNYDMFMVKDREVGCFSVGFKSSRISNWESVFGGQDPCDLVMMGIMDSNGLSHAANGPGLHSLLYNLKQCEECQAYAGNIHETVRNKYKALFFPRVIHDP